MYQSQSDKYCEKLNLVFFEDEADTGLTIRDQWPNRNFLDIWL